MRAATILYYNITSNIIYVDSLMITDLLSKLETSNIVTASLLKQLQYVKFRKDDNSVVNVNRNHWILTSISPLFSKLLDAVFALQLSASSY